MSNENYTIDDVQSDLGHIVALLDVALETVLEHPFGEPLGLYRVNRLSALLWAVRNIAEEADKNIEGDAEHLRNASECNG